MTKSFVSGDSHKHKAAKNVPISLIGTQNNGLLKTKSYSHLSSSDGHKSKSKDKSAGTRLSARHSSVCCQFICRLSAAVGTTQHRRQLKSGTTMLPQRGGV